MEFKFRAVDDRPSSSSSTVRYFSSDRTFRGQSVSGQSVLPTWALTSPLPSSDSRTSSDPTRSPNPDYFTMHDPILHPTNARDARQRKMEKDRIREEILAAEMARRRVLEAEVRRELMLEREMALKKAIGDGLGFDDAFGPMTLTQAHSCLPLDTVPRLPEPVADYSEVNKELTSPAGTPELNNNNKDKLIVLAKPNANLSGLKRKSLPSEDTNEIFQHCPKNKKKLKEEKKKKIPKEEWSCALCHVTVANEKMLGGHLNGRRHLKRLRDEKLGWTSCDASLLKNTKLFEPKELVATGTASSQLGANRKMSLLGHNEASDGLDKKMQDTDTSKEKTSEEKKVELPVQEDQCGEDLTNNVEVKTVHTTQRKEQPTKTKRFEFLCDICKVGSNNPKVMEKHRRAKKHMDKLKELKENKVRSTNKEKANTSTIKSSGPVKSLQEDTENGLASPNVIKEAKTSIPTTISVALLATSEKAEYARLQESINVAKEANVSTLTTISVASPVATQESVKNPQQGSEYNVSPANVIKEADAYIPTRIDMASLVATEKPETASLQGSINVDIGTVVAASSWGAKKETGSATLLQESIKKNIPTTNVTREAKANMPATTSAAVESFWATASAENLRKLDAYAKLIKARLTE